jgi:hypothetical protein
MRNRDATDAFRRGDVGGLLAVVKAVAGDKAPEELARFAIELRRENVAVIGQHDAFVRHTASGSLRQVIQPVRLSLHDDTLYQLPQRMKVHQGTENAYDDKKGGRWEWISTVKEKHKANVSYQGLLRLNAVAGCAVGMPPEVMVDGEARTNPYRKLTPKGDLERIVVTVNVVGPSPMTGNPVIVQYTLDLDPARDLQHMLSELMPRDGMQRAVFLMDSDMWDEYRSGLEGRDQLVWKLLPLYGGVGIAHDLSVPEVRKVYRSYVGILQNALKKALTVARRNAMKAHPALAFHSVRIDNDGNATVRGVGWADTGGGMDRYMQLMERMARGLLPDLEELHVETIEAEYDPEEHAVGDAAVDAVVEDDDDNIDPELAERNGLVQQIDGALGLLSTSQVGKLKYDPANMDTQQLRDTLGQINTMLDDEGA